MHTSFPKTYVPLLKFQYLHGFVLSYCAYGARTSDNFVENMDASSLHFLKSTCKRIKNLEQVLNLFASKSSFKGSDCCLGLLI